MSGDEKLGRGLPPGEYREFVGPPEVYDLVSHLQFNLLTLLGLREEHTLLDIGCGSLRGGRLFILYLLPGRYCGIEPNAWLVEEGIKNELGRELVEMKRPRFSHGAGFACTEFGQEFDFFLAQSIFSHAAPQQIRRCLAEVRKCMNPRSLFAATYFEGEESYSGTDWVYPGKVTYRPEWMVEAASEAGLACVPIRWVHPRGQSWLVFHLPGLALDIREICSSVNLSVPLQEELRWTKAELHRLESHPYVRFGRAVNRLVKRLTGRAVRPPADQP
ncbi:MAG: class I SAM-dependent methyltransferase [Candidatus Acidiferrales bacterium]